MRRIGVRTSEMTDAAAGSRNDYKIARFDICLFGSLEHAVFIHQLLVQYVQTHPGSFVTYVISSRTSAEDWAHDFRIDIVGQQRQSSSIENNVFLKCSVLVVEMVRRL